MRYIIGDTETSGLGPSRKPCEVALMEVTENLEYVADAEAVLNPGVPISPEASAVHGMYDADVADKPSLEEWRDATFGGKIEGDITLIAFRVGFDKPLLAPLFEQPVRTFDVLTLAQTLVRGTVNHKLQTLKEHFQLPGGPAHRAMGDVATTHQLLQLLLPMSGRNLRAHCSTPLQVVHRMPWGRHSGTLLVELPASYRSWLLGLPDLDENLRKSLEMVGKTDYVFGKKKP